MSPKIEKTAGMALVKSYSIAVVAPLVAFLFWSLIKPLFNGIAPPVFFSVAVAAAAWTGGFFPALLSTFLSAGLVDWFMFQPLGSLAIAQSGDRIRLVAFCVASTLVAMIGGIAKNKSEKEKQMRLALQEANRRLEERVKERTSLLNDALMNLEAFSYSITHELRSPLHCITGFTDVLIHSYSSKLDKEGGDYLQYVRDSAAKMDQLITDLLQYSKLSSGNLQLEKVDVNDCIHSLLRDYPNFQQQKRFITLKSERPTTAVLANRTALTQAMANLINNALKFVKPNEQPRVEIEVLEANGQVNVSVSDHGVGIDDQYKQIIWEPFERVQGEKYPGSGIGLSVVKKAIERMNGTAGVESKPGEGSRFWIKLAKYHE